MATSRILYLVTIFSVVLIVSCLQQYKINHAKLVLSNDTKVGPRIFGGKVASDGEFPYMVFMLYQSSSGEKMRCSASLVTWDKVLLAAHCFNDDQQVNPNNVIVVAGKASLKPYIRVRLNTPDDQLVDENALGVQERRAEEVFINPDFRECSQTCNHDVAIISVRKPFQPTPNVQILPISREPLTTGTSCTILGWGLVDKNKDNLELVYGHQIHAVPLSECKYKSEGSFYCLVSRRTGICQGDSGSPLVCNGKAVGVASHTLSKSDQNMCGSDMEEYYAILATESYWFEPLLAELRTSPTATTDTNSGAGLVTSFAVMCVSILSLVF